MILSLSITDIKDFMSKFLKDPVFDDFELHSIAIHSFANFEIYKSNIEQNPPKWAVLRPFAFDIIKGGKTPKSIKAVLAMPGNMLDIPQATLFLNIFFEDGKINITSGISQSGFSLDKTGAQQWNEYITNFLRDNNISFQDNL